MPTFLSNLVKSLQGHRSDMAFLCHRLLSEGGGASQTAIAQEIITAYRSMKPKDRPAFFEILSREFSPRPSRRPPRGHRIRTRRDGKLYDPVATFHLANGARLERINSYGNLRPYGLEASFGVTVNYRYLPNELEENHERFVRSGQIRVPSSLFQEHNAVAAAWERATKLPSTSR